MIALLDGLHFTRPLWLWALLVLPVLAGCWWARRRNADIWRSAIDAHLLPHLIERRVDRGGLLGLAGWMLAALCAVLALAGPGWRQLPAPLQGTTSAPLVVALELSTATNAGDLPPSRLLQARAKLAGLFAARGAGETALLVFADDAFTVAPLTEDAANLALYLDALSPDIMPAGGQRADRAIEQATRLLRQRSATQGEILLMASQADSAAISEAATAARMGYRVSALGLGTPEGAAHRDGTGALAHARLDAPSLEALAAAGGGRYVRLTADDADLRALDVRGTRADPASSGITPASGASAALRWADQGYWFVLPLLCLVLLAFRRGGALMAVACIALLPALPSFAQDTSIEGTPWRRADQVEHARMLEGTEAYRAGRYADAAQRWAALPGAEAAYNRGNALAKQGELDAAIDAYDAALRLRPGMADAEANRAAVDAARRRTPPPGPGQDPRAPPRGQPQNAGRPSPGDGAPSPGQPRQPSPPASPDTPPTPAPPSPEATPEPEPASPNDAEAQRQADAAQRERMQRALDARNAAGDETPQAGAPDAARRDTADAERRQANEALLRRLPDDPGGLLRAKFRLEHERRRNGETR